MTSKLILMRHGQSIWNKRNLFTGWVDIPLSEEGVQEAIEGGRKIQNEPIDIVFTSSLIRAQMTTALALLHHGSGKIPLFQHPGGGKLEEWAKIHGEAARKMTIPVFMAWELNERMYGSLQGLDKAETAAKYGAEQVQIWRRSYAIAPPEGESLAMTVARAVPYFIKRILPRLEKGENVFIAAHGNSLRAIVMHLEGLNQDEVVKLELATGAPLIYTQNQGRWKKQ